RNSLTFAGSVASQLNGLAPIAGSPDRYLLLKNNAPGFALLDFSGTGDRSAETRRLDLGVPATLGAVRFNRLRAVDAGQLNLSLEPTAGGDAIEGWSQWTPRKANDGGGQADSLRGRYVSLRVQIPATVKGDFELDKASLFHLPQDRRPVLVDFRVVSPN